MSEVMKCKLPFRKLQLPEITKWLEEKDSEGWNLKKLRGNTATCNISIVIKIMLSTVKLRAFVIY